MKRHLLYLTPIFVAVVAFAGEGRTDKTRKPPEMKVTAQDLGKMKVLTDGDGHYIVVAPFTNYEELFYGDGKTFYQLSSMGGSSDSTEKSWKRYFWAPVVRGTLKLLAGGVKWQVSCGERVTQLNELKKEQASKLLARASFHEELWDRSPYYLARDERGNYYYVDRLVDKRGGKGFRLWVGPKGALKKKQMTNIVSDSEGDIFATKSGDLRLQIDHERKDDGRRKKKSYWVVGDKKLELKTIPTRQNRELIYAELGVYTDNFGTPCDDL